MNTSISGILRCWPAMRGDEVTVGGWVRTRRDSKLGSFIVINDGSCTESIQVVARTSLVNYHSEVRRVTTGCSVIVTGKIVGSHNVEAQHLEMEACAVDITGWVDNPETYPISAKRHSMEHLRRFSHLRPRTETIGAIARVRHAVAQIVHKFMDENSFLWLPTPLISSLNAEGAGEMFEISTVNSDDPSSTRKRCGGFFDRRAFLTVSGQLHAESHACALSRVYTFGPIFRAENSNTTRHLAEFWMIEPEMAYTSLGELINFSERMLKHICQRILAENLPEIQLLDRKTGNRSAEKLRRFVDTGCAQISYDEAIDILGRRAGSSSSAISWGADLSTEHERYLIDKLGAPVILRNPPRTGKAFYMRANDDGRTVAAMDVIFPEVGEIIGGSQREERIEMLDARLAELDLKGEDYWWYRDLRRYGTVPHSGFGLGLERLLSYITGVENVRDVTPFPRSPGSLNF